MSGSYCTIPPLTAWGKMIGAIRATAQNNPRRHEKGEGLAWLKGGGGCDGGGGEKTLKITMFV